MSTQIIFQVRVFHQAAYTIGNNSSITLLPRSGHLVSDIPEIKPQAKVSDIMNGLKKKLADNKMYFCPSMSLVNVKLAQDQSKPNMTNNAALFVADKSKRYFQRDYFSHYPNNHH